MATKSKFNPITPPFDAIQDFSKIEESLLPLTDSAIDLGSTTKYFKDAYVDNLYVSEKSNFAYSTLSRFYDYNGVTYPSTSGNTAKQKIDATLANINATAPAAWGGTETSSYGALWENDDLFYQVHNSSTNSYIAQLFELQTGETGNVSSFDITWRGNQSAKTYRTYIWNFDTSTWTLLGSTKSNTSFETFTYTITDSPNSYFDSNGKFYFLVSSITKQTALYALRTDYISLETTTSTGDLEFTNSEFNDQFKIKKNSPIAFKVENEDGDKEEEGAEVLNSILNRSPLQTYAYDHSTPARSEERRVGKECPM
jgi:hypothetical protein